MAPLDVPLQTSWHPPSFHVHSSALVILPPGPNGLGFISLSPVHFPSKALSFWTSGPGLGGACCAHTTPAARQNPISIAVNRIASPFLSDSNSIPRRRLFP